MGDRKHFWMSFVFVSFSFFILPVVSIPSVSAAPAPFRRPCPPPKGSWSLITTRDSKTGLADDPALQPKGYLTVAGCDLDKGVCASVKVNTYYESGTTFKLGGTLDFGSKDAVDGQYSLKGIAEYESSATIQSKWSGKWTYSKGELTLQDETNTEQDYVFRRLVRTSCDNNQSMNTDDDYCGCEEYETDGSDEGIVGGGDGEILEF